MDASALHALDVGALSTTAAACGSPFSSEDGLAVPYGAVPVDAGVVLDADVDDASARLDSAAPLDTGVSVDTGVDHASSHLDSAVDADANETQDASVNDASASLDSAACGDENAFSQDSLRRSACRAAQHTASAGASRV